MLFAAIVLICVWAIFDPQVRALAAATSLSVIGFLLIYAMKGLPAGPLQTIAWVDLIAVAPIALVCWRAFQS